MYQRRLPCWTDECVWLNVRYRPIVVVADDSGQTDFLDLGQLR